MNNREGYIKVGVSARHVHLTDAHLKTLFGPKYELTPIKPLMGDEFAAKETVTIVSPAMRTIEGVRILGPCRTNSQVEISRTDTYKLKISAPVRPSGQIEGSAPITLTGPMGAVFLTEGCIIANRHIHMTPQDAEKMGLTDNCLVDVAQVGGDKPTVFKRVQIRVHENFDTQMHIDTDDANAGLLKDGDFVRIIGVV